MQLPFDVTYWDISDRFHAVAQIFDAADSLVNAWIRNRVHDATCRGQEILFFGCIGIVVRITSARSLPSSG